MLRETKLTAAFQERGTLLEKQTSHRRHRASEDLNSGPAVSNHTVARQYAGAAHLVFVVKAKAEAANWQTFITAVKRDVWV